MANVPDYVASAIRTITPAVAGYVIALPAAPRIEAALGVSSDTARGYVVAAIPVVLGAVYYLIVRALETKGSPKFGWLLGLARAVGYTKIQKAVQTVVQGHSIRVDAAVVVEDIAKAIAGKHAAPDPAPDAAPAVAVPMNPAIHP